MSKIDIIIPTYNRAKYLKIAIDSVLNQTFKDFNLFVLDNCSTDNTSEIIKSYLPTQLTYIRNKENLGFIGNLNKALETGNSEYFQIFHDDDMLKPNFIECVVAFLDKHKDLSFVHTAAHIINKENKIVKEQNHNYKETFTSSEFFKYFLKHGVGIICPSAVFRREKISGKIKFNFKTQFTADVVFFIESSNYGGVGYINKPIFNYREHIGSLTSSLYENYDIRLKDRFYHTKFLKEQIKSRNINDKRDYAGIYYKKSLSADVWFMKMQGVSVLKLLKLLPKLVKLSPSLLYFPFFWTSVFKIIIPLSFINYYKKKLRK